MMSFEEKFSFKGKLENNKNQECNVTVYVSYDKYHPEIINCTLSCLEEDESIFHNILYDLERNPKVIGETGRRQKIIIEYISHSHPDNQRNQAIINVST